jgi:fructan beta-fructosidase
VAAKGKPDFAGGVSGEEIAGTKRTKPNDPPDVVFEEFEKGYEKWKVEGDAFGTAPANGTLPNQQPVYGYFGR